MSELINNSKFRKEKLKELILKLHKGENPQQVRAELVNTLSQIPYGEVVEVEQELIAEGLPETEVLKFAMCMVKCSMDILTKAVQKPSLKDILLMFLNRKTRNCGK